MTDYSGRLQWNIDPWSTPWQALTGEKDNHLSFLECLAKLRFVRDSDCLPRQPPPPPPPLPPGFTPTNQKSL